MLIRSRLSLSIGLTIAILVLASALNIYISKEFSSSVETITNNRLKKERLLLQELSIINDIHLIVLEASNRDAESSALDVGMIDDLAKQFDDSLARLRDDITVDQDTLSSVTRSFQSYFIFSKKILEKTRIQDDPMDSIIHFREIQNQLTASLQGLYEQSGDILTDKIATAQTRLNVFGLLSLALFCCSALSVAYIMWSTSAYIVKPLNSLVRTVLGIEGGQQARFESSANDEISLMGSVFNKIADDIEQREIKLVSAKEEFAKIFDNSWEGIARAGLDGELLLISPGMARMFGYSFEDDDLDKLNTRKHYVDSSVRDAIMRRLMAGESSVEVEIELVKKSGQLFWGRLRASLYKGVAGDIQGVDIHIADISLQKMQKKLLLAKEYAEAASAAKTDFLATMSHEIRTPLFAILGMAEALEEADLTPEQGKFIETISVAGEQLQATIDNILNFSQIESGCISIENKPFQLDSISNDLSSLFRPLCASKALSFSCHLELPLELARRGDAPKIKQILINLIMNSLKYTETGSIDVVFKSESKISGSTHVLVVVRDTGIGIGKVQLEDIFKPFSQADTSISRKFGGAGLGLAITKKITKAMGGSITVVSKPGLGSTFTLKLPLPVVREQKQPAKRSNDQPNPAGVFSGMHFLVADDSEDNQLIIELYLKETGAKLDFVFDGQEAIESVESNAYDAVLMDIEMPRVNGLDATRQIRLYEQAHNAVEVPIIALTAHSFDEFRTRAIKAGCSDFISKPFKKKSLLKVIQGCI